MPDRAIPTAAVSLIVAIGAIGGCGSDSLKPADTPTVDTPQCKTSLQCSSGRMCVNGSCVESDPTSRLDPPAETSTDDPPTADPPAADDPKPDDPTNVPTDRPRVPTDISGQWSTYYAFDWSAYLQPWEQVAETLGSLEEGIDAGLELPFIGSLIADSIPDWLAVLAEILSNLVHFFSEVRVEASMTGTGVVGTAGTIHANERWLMGYVELLVLCSDGILDASYPSCAEVAIPFDTDARFGVVQANASSFDAHVDASNVMRTDPREVQVQMGRFVLRVVDELTEWATAGQFDSFATALTGLVDCSGLQAGVEDFLGTPVPGLEAECQTIVDDIILPSLTLLDELTIEWNVMSFEQMAAVYDRNADGAADQLGQWSTDPGQILNGQFRAAIAAEMAGEWVATRP